MDTNCRTLDDYTSLLERAFGIDQLFVRREKANSIVLLVAEVDGAFLIAGCMMEAEKEA